MKMKRKTRNRTVLLAALCLCISCLAGCKGTDNKNDNIDSDALSRVTETPAIATTEPSESNAGWQVIKSFTYTQTAYIIAFYNPDFGITAGHQGEISYSCDQGDTWTEAQNKTASLYGIDFVNKDIAFACGDNRDITKTTDGGRTWNSVSDFGGNVPGQCKMLSFVDENTGLIAGDNKLAYTSDSGNTWTELTPPAKIMAIYLTSAKKGYLIGQDKKMYVTSDAGATWKAQELKIQGFENVTSIPHTCAFAIAEDGTGIFFYIEKGGILKCFETTDGALSWTESSELNIADAVIKPFLLYLTHDASCLSIQSLNSNAAAIVVYKE